MSAAFLITTLIVVVTPGIGVVYTLAAGLTQGRRASVGPAALLNTSAAGFQALKIAGVAYLLLMAWRALQEQGALQIETGPVALGAKLALTWR